MSTLLFGYPVSVSLSIDGQPFDVTHCLKARGYNGNGPALELDPDSVHRALMRRLERTVPAPTLGPIERAVEQLASHPDTDVFVRVQCREQARRVLSRIGDLARARGLPIVPRFGFSHAKSRDGHGRIYVLTPFDAPRVGALELDAGDA